MNLSALKYPDYRLYFFIGVGSVNALWILRIVIGWLAWDLTHSASFVGIIAGLSLMPSAIGGPFFGVWVDRTDVKIANYLTVIGMIVCVSFLLTTTLLNITNPPILLAIALGVGIVAAAHSPVRLSMGPRLVEPSAVSSVVAMGAINFNFARLLGPAVGGVLIDKAGIAIALVVTLSLYLPAIFLLYRVRPRPIDTTTTSSYVRSFIEGLSYIKNRPSIVAALLLIGLTSIVVRGMMEMLPVIADGTFERGATGLGQLTSVIGAGSLLSAILKALSSATTSKEIDLLTYAISTVAMIVVWQFGTTQSWALALIYAALLGFCVTHIGVTIQAAIQTQLPDEMRGRVMSIWIVMAMAFTAIGALIQGVIVELAGIEITAIAAAIFGLVCLGAQRWFYLLQRRKKMGG